MPVYDPPRRCSGKCQPGVLAYRAVVYSTFATLRSGGCYNCRSVRGGATLSEHGEGRAEDSMTGKSWARSAEAERLANLCVKFADELGVQGVIYYRRIWGYGRWYWREYGGSNPHTDHVHVGFNNGGALKLTEAKVRRIFGENGGGDWLDVDEKTLRKIIREETTNVLEDVTLVNEGGIKLTVRAFLLLIWRHLGRPGAKT